jgi:glycosyltransferase involved in cell wall biosynthesis
VLPRGRIARAVEVKRLAWGLRREYDAVFVHMNPEYLIVAGPLWKILRKRVVLWYTHRQVNLKLRLALFFVDRVATAAPESFGIKSKKVAVLGHGVEVARFARVRPEPLHEPLQIASVGRVTPIKHLETLVEALALLKERGRAARVSFIGAPSVPGDVAYETRLKTLACSRGVESEVEFTGAALYREMPERYAVADISINLAPTGGIDKAVLEAMAAGAIPLVANRAFAPYFGPYASRLLFRFDDAADLAEKIEALCAAPDLLELRQALAASVTERGSVDRVVVAILELLA